MNKMDLIAIKKQWENEGFCIFPNFMETSKVTQLKIICDNILEQWLAGSSEPLKLANLTNMPFLTEPIYFKNKRNELIELLELIADPKLLEILKFISDNQEILFHNTQYFFNPATRSSKGMWHRDTQFLAPDPELEKQRMKQSTAVHFRISFLRDNCLEYVSGSEKRWDTPEEYAIRKGGKEANNSDEMPEKRRIALNPGDALLFHAWGIHRGLYHVESPRRTFDILYQWGNICDYCPPPPTCFEDLSLLTKLSPGVKYFFENFRKTYEKYWQ